MLRIISVLVMTLLFEAGAWPLPSNHQGDVMVLMYHDIGPKEKTWVRTPDNFRKDLQTLYQQGYRTIALRDYIDNNIRIPAGTSPVVITFDDGTQGQFNMLEDDGPPRVDPDSAVGILEQFYRSHPDFGLEATFFVTGTSPFGQPAFVDDKLNYIVNRGMDIGNHTTNHSNLGAPGNQRASYVQKVIAEQARFLESRITQENYKIDTLALCFGKRPSDASLHKYLIRGHHNGFNYHNRAILNVGSKPAPAPGAASFNPRNIHRVRASELNINLGLYNWIRHFQKHPTKRYVK